MVYLILGFFLLSSIGQAADERSLAQLMGSTINPFYEAQPAQFFKGAKNAKIHFRKFEGNAGKQNIPVLFLPGRTEAIKEYAELFYDLTQKGMTVYAMDHRGQGASSRLAANQVLGHVEDFNDYIEDFYNWSQMISKQEGGRPLHIVAYSMGGAIATAAIIEDYAREDVPDVYKSAVLVSPMLGIKLPVAKPVAYAILRLLKGFGRGDKTLPWLRNEVCSKLQPFDCAPVKHTTSKERFHAQGDVYRNEPELLITSPSVNWLIEALRGTDRMEHQYQQFDLPLLVINAGEDAVVKSAAHENLCRRMLGSSSILTYPASFHEVLQERDEIRTPALEQIIGAIRHAESQPIRRVRSPEEDHVE